VYRLREHSVSREELVDLKVALAEENPHLCLWDLPEHEGSYGNVVYIVDQWILEAHSHPETRDTTGALGRLEALCDYDPPDSRNT